MLLDQLALGRSFRLGEAAQELVALLCRLLGMDERPTVGVVLLEPGGGEKDAVRPVIFLRAAERRTLLRQRLAVVLNCW
jgi:hypothetical protein